MFNNRNYDPLSHQKDLLSTSKDIQCAYFIPFEASDRLISTSKDYCSSLSEEVSDGEMPPFCHDLTYC